MRTKFIKQIHSCFASFSSNDVYLERSIFLDFLPTVGMEMGGEKVLQVLCDWNGQVSCYVAEDKTFYEKGLQLSGRGIVFFHETVEFQQIVSAYLSQGWSLRKRK